MLEAYCDNIQEHIQQCVQELDDLNHIMAQRSLSRHEYRAAERLLQILIESCIGLSKHWLKSLSKRVATDAYQSLMLLEQEGVLSEVTLNWRSIIGMRNALVHDYLNIDTDTVKGVIKDKTYVQLSDFSELAISGLRTQG